MSRCLTSLRVFALSVLAALAVGALSLHVAAQDDGTLAFLDTLHALSLDQRLERGIEYKSRGQELEKAVLCLAAAADCYRPEMDTESKRKCLKALNVEYGVLNLGLFDYSRSHDVLMQAADLAAQEGIEDAHLLFNFGAYYQQSYHNTGRDEYLDSAFNSYKHAFAAAQAEADWDQLNAVFPNLVSMGAGAGRMDEVAPYHDLYTASANSDSTFRRYNLLLYKGVKLLGEGNLAGTERIFERQLELLPPGPRYARMRCMSFLQLSRLHKHAGRYALSLAALDSAWRTANANGMTPEAIDTRRERAEILMMTGDSSAARDVQLQYLVSQDSMMQRRIAANVATIGMMQRYRDTGVRLQTERRNRQRTLWGALATAAVLLLTAAAAVVIWRKNKQLRAANSVLYERMQQMLEPPAPPDTHPEPDRECQDSDRRLWDEIKRVAAATDEVYTPGFNIARMAELVASNTKYVSQAINLCYGSGFPMFLSELRVKEACRRMEDVDRYGNLTLDVLAQEVGIKSRTTFATAFRRVVGMSPSEYMREARRRAARKTND